MTPYQCSGGLVLTAVFIVGLYWVTSSIHQKESIESRPPDWQCTPRGNWNHPNCPTPDQLYGCTVAQQAPNGECR